MEKRKVVPVEDGVDGWVRSENVGAGVGVGVGDSIADECVTGAMDDPGADGRSRR